MTRSQMEGYMVTLCDVNNVSDKRYGLKIVGKPYEGKPHVRFDEGLLGRQGRTSGLLYNPLVKTFKISSTTA